MRSSRLRAAVLALLALHLLLPVAHAAGSEAKASVAELMIEFAGLLVPIAALLWFFGYSEAAKNTFIWAIVIAAMAAWVSSYTGGLPGASGEAQVFWPPGEFYRDVPVSVVVTQPGANVSAIIDWGDGHSSTCSGTGYCVASHVYGSEGVYTIAVSGSASGSYTVRIRSIGSLLEEGFSKLEADCGWSPTSWPGCIMVNAAKAVGKAFAILSDAAVWLLAHTGAGGVFEKIGLMLVTVPEGAPLILDAHGYALFLLGYAVVGLALWRAFWEFEKGLSWLDALREVAFVLLALSLAQPLYVWAARLVNSISVAMAQPGILMAWMSMLLAVTALAAALPVGGAGGLAAAGALGFAGFILVALLKYLLLEAMYLLLPLIAVLWLFPGTRHVARSMANIVASLMAWNLVLAAMAGLSARALASPASASPLEVIGYGVAMPLAMLAAGPMIAGIFGAPLPGASLFARAWGFLGGAVAARLGLQRAAPQPAIAAAPGAVIGHTDYIRPPMHAAASGAWQPPVAAGTATAITVPSPTTPGHARTTEYLRPQAGPTAEQVLSASTTPGPGGSCPRRGAPRLTGWPRPLRRSSRPRSPG